MAGYLGMQSCVVLFIDRRPVNGFSFGGGGGYLLTISYLTQLHCVQYRFRDAIF
jgi:hypothetical protein